MKTTLLSIFTIGLLTLGVNAQTSYNVSATPNMVFSPSSLTIEVGDTVVWTNTGGTHNVNGTTTTFPSNPDSFSSGAPASGWTYFFVFTVAGTYDYQCDPHAGAGMTGTITVNTPSTITELDVENGVSIYPNPFFDKLSIELSEELLKENSNIKFELYDLLGNQVQTIAKVNSELTRINTEDLSNGIYIYAFKSEGRIIKTGKLTNK